ncbi:hypothetical protein ACQR1W_31470 [Bradyrhizobium sp. HKCCYLS1011]|uniref:hypothetical protein n=1 Tax=Bradyrhizobium sp. HKCCYLS1011 TaxID=3420733 RepID=UPI003EBE8662
MRGVGPLPLCDGCGASRKARGEEVSREKAERKAKYERYCAAFEERVERGRAVVVAADSEDDLDAAQGGIDSSKGYAAGNVQWIHKDLNHMKLDFDQDYFVEMCMRVADHHRAAANDNGQAQAA